MKNRNHPKIFLASRSPQRRKILRALGLKFKVVAGRAKEKRKMTSSCAGLVVANARAKAKDGGRRVKSGVVIAADTVVFSGGKVMGKPRSLGAAKKMLKILSRRPQWVYTGLAVMDVDKGKIFTGYEKTKVYMDKLSDKEIDGYFRQVSPLDKAGSFDIQGPGSIFIRRIEGCFYNVVGLPVAKLHKLLKKAGVPLLILLMSFYLGGCYTEYNIATQKQETLFYSTEKEVNMGISLSREFEKEYKPLRDVAAQERVERVGERIATVCDRKELVYHFRAVDEKEVNAVSLPGGYVYVNKGLLDAVKSDDELAAVIAHEVGHIVARHGIKKLQAMWGYTLLNVLASQTNPDFAQGVNLAFLQIFFGYSQEDENLADKLAVKYTKEAGFDPQAMVSFLVRLKEIHQKEPDRPFSYWRTHPYISQRIAKVRQELTGRMEFRDYLNLDNQ